MNNEFRNPENQKILTKWKKNDKIGGKSDLKNLKLMMLVMRFLTNKQVFKTPSWYLNKFFGEKL